MHEILQDEIVFENTTYASIFKIFSESVQSKEKLSEHHFTNHNHPHIQNTCIRLMSSKYSLSENWKKLEVIVPEEKAMLKNAAFSAVFHLKLKKIQLMILENQQVIKLKASNDEDVTEQLKLQKTLENIKADLTNYSQIVVVK